jgi:hypothetical protein
MFTSRSTGGRWLAGCPKAGKKKEKGKRKKAKVNALAKRKAGLDWGTAGYIIFTF